MKKHFSWSEHFLFNYDKDRYIDQYILGKEFEATPEMKTGKLIHKTIEAPAYPLNEKLKELGYHNGKIYKVRKCLDKVVRFPLREEMYRAEVNGVSFLIIPDGLEKEGRKIRMAEYKTTKNKWRWTQKKVDMDGQASFYSWILWELYHEYLQEIMFQRLKIDTGTTKTFWTARGYYDHQHIKEEVFATIAELKRESLWEKRLSKKEAEQLRGNKLV